MSDDLESLRHLRGHGDQLCRLGHFAMEFAAYYAAATLRAKSPQQWSDL